MRVPIPIVVVLCLVVIGGAWWWWTRERDFLQPPPEVELAEVGREEIPAEISSSATDDDDRRPSDETATVGSQQAAEPIRLAEYARLASDSPGSLAALAADLSARGEFQRALLANERIVDSTTLTGDPLAEALQTVRKLRAQLPLWNPRPEDALIVTLHAGTGEDSAARVEPVIQRLAEEMSRASSGILSVRPKIHRGPARAHGDLPPPVAVWMGGAADDSPTTLVRSITLSGEQEPLADIALTLLEILADRLSKEPTLRVPLPTVADDPARCFVERITRLAWEKLGSGLNPPHS